jgi:hypothetical protein
MIQPRAADDFAMVCARMKELRRERERAEAAEAGGVGARVADSIDDWRLASMSFRRRSFWIVWLLPKPKVLELLGHSAF